MKRLYVLLLLLFAAAYGFAETAPFTKSLYIPPLLENQSSDPEVARFAFTAGKHTSAFFPDVETPTYGYNGPYLGPTIRASEGQRVEIAVTNQLGESTTVHWHGLHVPGEMDGGPHQVIAPGDTWRPEFVITQEAATLWYHPHLLGKTGEHAYMGLAGLFIIDDENANSLNLPGAYGIDDIPLVIQDKRFFENGELAYVTGMPDIMHGVIGNYIFINGVHEPYVEVPKGLVRLRFLNGSDSTIHRYRLSGEAGFAQIATDGGLLEHPITVENMVLSPGERVEAIVDFSGFTKGEELFLEVDLYSGDSYRAMRFAVGDPPAEESMLPEVLNTIEPIAETEADRTRVFRMETRGMGGFTINGRTMDMDRIDVSIRLGSTEIWEIQNTGMMNISHSFHVHDVQFQILDINGGPPPPQLSGWKDTVLLWPGDTVRFIARYLDFTGIYMYHCHLLVHEDQGMMGQFEVYDESEAQ